MLHHGFGSFTAWPQAKCHLEYYSKDNCNNGLCGRDVLSSGVSWDRRFFPVLSPATGTLGASRVAICGQRWNAVSIKPQRRSTEGMNYWKAQSFSCGVLISTVQLIWCCCVSLLSDRTCNAPAPVGRPGCGGGRARHRVTPTSSASQPVGSCLIKLKMRGEITRSKNKPRQFEPTHLKLHLIMEMEIVKRAAACVHVWGSVHLCACLFVCSSDIGLRDLLCNLIGHPRSGDRCLEASGWSMGNVHSAECGSLIRPLIYLTGKVLPFHTRTLRSRHEIQQISRFRSCIRTRALESQAF